MILCAFFMYFVYILYSKNLNIYYKGFTANFEDRFSSHLLGKSTYSSRATDWVIVYTMAFNTKQEALKEEKRIKKLNRISIVKLIDSLK